MENHKRQLGQRCVIWIANDSDEEDERITDDDEEECGSNDWEERE